MKSLLNAGDCIIPTLLIHRQMTLIKKFSMILPALTGMMFVALTSCAAGSDHSTANQEVSSVDSLATEEPESNVKVNEAGGYGKVITLDDAMQCDQLVASISATEDLPAKVQGTVTAACQMSGCWMKMDCGNGEQMRVTFRDYGFFVPKDLAGSQVVVEGSAMKKEVSVETLRHFAQDEGKSAEEIAAITEPEWELEFVADGVMPVK